MTLTIITICIGLAAFIDLFEYAMKEAWGVAQVISFLVVLPLIITLLVLGKLEIIAITFIIGAWIFGRFTVFKKSEPSVKRELKDCQNL